MKLKLVCTKAFQLLFTAFSIKINIMGLICSGDISTPTQDRKKEVADMLG